MHGVVLFGRPCSGKSAIGHEFAGRFGYTYISSGDIARELAEGSRKMQEDLAAGKMAPEEEMRAQVRYKIRCCRANGDNFVLDGFPRFMDQHDFLKRTFPDMCLIYAHIFASEQTVMDRSRRRNRGDDGAILARLKYFEENTYDILRHCQIMINNNGQYEIGSKAMELYGEVLRYADDSKI